MCLPFFFFFCDCMEESLWWLLLLEQYQAEVWDDFRISLLSLCALSQLSQHLINRPCCELCLENVTKRGGMEGTGVLLWDVATHLWRWLTRDKLWISGANWIGRSTKFTGSSFFWKRMTAEFSLSSPLPTHTSLPILNMFRGFFPLPHSAWCLLALSLVHSVC